MSPETARKIKELEARKPDPEKNPYDFSRINEEISRLIDADRAFSSAAKGSRVV